jgi:hypothetical protein
MCIDASRSARCNRPNPNYNLNPNPDLNPNPNPNPNRNPNLNPDPNLNPNGGPNPTTIIMILPLKLVNVCNRNLVCSISSVN